MDDNLPMMTWSVERCHVESYEFLVSEVDIKLESLRSTHVVVKAEIEIRSQIHNGLVARSPDFCFTWSLTAVSL